MLVCFSLGLYFSRTTDQSQDSHPIISLKASSPDFTGREEYLEQLYKELVQSKKKADFATSSYIKVLWGKGGFGKTELAIEFANRHLSHYSLIWTFFCDSSASLDQSYRNLAKKLEVPIQDSDSSSEVKEKVHHQLENRHCKLPWLLIYDNVEDELTYPQRGGSILMTSQKKMLSPSYLLEVQPFSREEAFQLLEKITSEKRGQAMEQLVQDLDGIPLLINYAAHYIHMTPGCDISEYQKLFLRNSQEMNRALKQDKDINHRYFKSLETSWEFPLKALKKESPKALQWLFICAYFYPEHICEEWIDDWLMHTFSYPKEDVCHTRNEFLMVLRNYGVIRYDEQEKSFSLHRLFLQMIRSSRKDYVEEDLSQVLEILNRRMNDYDFTNMATWKIGERWFCHASEVTKWIEHYRDCLAEKRHCYQIANIYHQMGNLSAMSLRFLEALSYCEKGLGFLGCTDDEDHFRRSLIYITQARWLHRLCQWSEALETCQKAEAIQIKCGKTSSLDYAMILNIKGLILYDLDEPELALDFYRRALEIRRVHLGEVHTQISRNLHNIALCLGQMKKHQEAIEIFNQVTKFDDVTCGRHHPVALWTLIRKAEVIHQQGDHVQALSLLKKTTQEFLSISPNCIRGFELGPAWNLIGDIYFHQQKYKLSRKMYRTALKSGRKYHKPTSIYEAYRGMGMGYLKERKVEKGLNYLTKGLEVGFKTYENVPKKMTQVLKTFEEGLREAQRLKGQKEAIQIAAIKAFNMSSKTLGADHPVTQYLLEIQSSPCD